MSPKRGVVLLSLLLLPLLLLGAILRIHPFQVTGPFYEIEIKSIQLGPRGTVERSYDDRLAYGTAIGWDLPPEDGQKRGSDSWARRSQGGSLHPTYPGRTPSGSSWAPPRSAGATAPPRRSIVSG